MNKHKRLYPTIEEEITLRIFKENPTISVKELKKRVNEELKQQIKSMFRRK